MLKTEALILAMQHSNTVSFQYDGKHRIVEVHACGTSTKDGSEVMRGYQVAGESSRPLPCWALFTVEKMDALTISAFKDSAAPRAGYAENDRQMATIIAQLMLEDPEDAHA